MRPIRGTTFCFSHHPEYQEQAAEARRRGGKRRGDELAIARSYNLGAATSWEDIKAIVRISILDTLELPNSPNRTRALLAAVNTMVSLIEKD